MVSRLPVKTIVLPVHSVARAALSNSAGFGGHNVSVAVRGFAG